MKSKVNIFNSDFQDIFSKLKSRADLIVLDWPFARDTPMTVFENGFELAEKLVDSNGNVVSVHFPEDNVILSRTASAKGLLLVDTIFIEMQKKYKHPGMMANGLVSMFVFTKTTGVTKRTINDTPGIRRYYGRSRDHIPTNFWNNRLFKPGYRWKADKVNEAMPRWVVNKMLRTFVKPGQLVYDFFGGAGTVPEQCMLMNVSCTSTELNEARIPIIKNRIERVIDKKECTLEIK
jgi:hypothetical protein